MQNRKPFRIVLAIACFIFAGVKAYEIIKGEYEWLDVFFLVAFLGFGTMYLVAMKKENK
ncbi:hypothetical protein [Pontibacter vulgaris]|uniref:hypothetical protein n=1 Tax=Pontibacter vulgaris TaxID=2905679 RepID=UPI001FA70F92|nr:hypothetical protein [Pontibacter vulgaris]